MDYLIRQRGFTLIELLVVITIIVVLLALLTPALDKAIYQAELATCGANLKGLGSGVISYAMAAKRTYPYRRMVHEKQHVQPGQLTYPDTSDALNDYDIRPMLGEFSSIKNYLCPLAGGFDADTTDPNGFVYSNYNLFFGWKQVPSDGVNQPGLEKVGQKWGWMGQRFTALAADQDVISYAFGAFSAWSAHPDLDGKTSFDELNGADSAAFVIGGNPSGRYYTSKYGGPRGEMDINCVFTDGSAQTQRIAGVSPRSEVGRSPHYNSTATNSNNAAQTLQGENPNDPTNGTWNSIPLP